MLRFVKKQFFEYQESTIGAAFLTQTIQLNDAIVKFEIWDTAGQESFRSITKIFYRGAHAAIMAYSIVKKETFEDLEDWLKEAKNSCSPDV